MKTFRQWLNESKDIPEIKDVDTDVLDSVESKSFNDPKWDMVDKYGRPRKLKYSYHGTTMKHAQNILANGARKSGISLTGNPHEGRGYAHLHSEHPTGGALLRVDNSYLNPKAYRDNDAHTAQNIIHRGPIPKEAFKLIGKVSPKKGKT